MASTYQHRAEPAEELPPLRSAWPRYEDDEIEAVVSVLRSGRVNSLHHGDNCRAFERAFATMCDMPHGIALANGTLALELALVALDIGPGDEVLVTPRSFMASASCIRTVGADPVFADVDADSQNVTAATLAAALTPQTRAVIVVHLAGWPADMPAIMAFAQAHNLKVIEDCAQAHGARIDGRSAGSFGDAAAFSFCTDKIISTGGEGGMLLLRDDRAWEKAWSIKDHGKNFHVATSPNAGNSFRWLHDGFGTNLRLTEMQAALGLRQLAKLPDWIDQRRRNAALLDAILHDVPVLRIPLPPASVEHSYYKYYAFVREAELRRGWNRDRIVETAVAAGVPCGSGTCPEIYREKAFTRFGGERLRPLHVAAELGRTSLMLPVDHTLSVDTVVAMGERLRAVLEQAQ